MKRNDDVSLKTKIFNAALEELSEKGYQQASTNCIVEKAKVSKGLIFHYYKNKEKLFLECLRHSFEKYKEYYAQRVDLKITDYFVRMRKFAYDEMAFVRKFPSESKIIADSYSRNFEKEIKQQVEAIKDEYNEDVYKRLFENLDTSIFRDDIPIEKILKYIYLSTNAVMDKVNEECDDMHSLAKDYIDKDSENHKEALKKVSAIFAEYTIVEELIKNGVYKKKFE